MFLERSLEVFVPLEFENQILLASLVDIKGSVVFNADVVKQVVDLHLLRVRHRDRESASVEAVDMQARHAVELVAVIKLQQVWHLRQFPVLLANHLRPVLLS